MKLHLGTDVRGFTLVSMLGASSASAGHVYSLSFLFPSIFERYFTTTSETHVAEQYFSALMKKGSARSIERELGKINAQLTPSCVEKVVQRCGGNKILGLRFFIWAVQQRRYIPTNYVYRTTCRVLGVQRKPTMLFQVLAGMKEEGCVVSVKTFRVMINLCKEGKLVEEALDLRNRMEDFNCTADVPIYNTLIHLLCEVGHIDKAKVMLNQMLELGVFPDLVTYAFLIKGYATAGQLEDTHMLLLQMREHGCIPSVVIYTDLIHCYCKAGCPEKGLELLVEMLQNQCAPNCVTYTAVIQGFCETGRVKEASDILDIMITNGCSPNTVTFNILVNALCMEGKIDDVDELMRKMIEGGHLPKDKCYSSFIMGLLRTSKVGEAENLLINMLANGVYPSDLAYNTLIQVSCLCGRYSNALDWYHKMKNTYCLELEACSILLHGLCDQGYVDEVEIVFEGMIDKGNPLEVSTFDAVIRHLSKAGRHEKALKLSSNFKCQRSAVKRQC